MCAAGPLPIESKTLIGLSNASVAIAALSWFQPSHSANPVHQSPFPVFQNIPFQRIGLVCHMEANLMKNEITITAQRRVVSQHASGVIRAYDSQHTMLKVALEGTVMAELVQESMDSDAIYGKYRNQLLTVKNGRDASVIEF